jgi:molybdate transport system ATP-binding protein
VYFDTTATCFETVASGLFDTIGLFRKLSATDKALVNQWLELFGFSSSAHKMLKTLSIGEQRLLLLARALIKNPPLLILDEPCQGLDDTQSATMIQWIDAICIAGHKTMVYVTHYQLQKPECVTLCLSLPSPSR